MYRDGIAKMFDSAIDTDNKLGGVESWSNYKMLSMNPGSKPFQMLHKLLLESLEADDEAGGGSFHSRPELSW